MENADYFGLLLIVSAVAEAFVYFQLFTMGEPTLKKMIFISLWQFIAGGAWAVCICTSSTAFQPPNPSWLLNLILVVVLGGVGFLSIMAIGQRADS